MRFLGITLFLTTLAYAQTPAELRLTVTDPSGSPIPAAAGKLENLTTDQDRTFETDARGLAIVTALPPGRYRLEVSKPGFAPQLQSLDIQGVVERSIALTLGSQSFKVDVVSTTPLGGVDRPLDEIAAPVQAATQRELEQSGALEISDFINRRLNGVHVNEIQGNPQQMDLNYRGYTASPLLGTPQGLSIYMDGVRLNQPFGDVVSWDLIPRVAVEEMALMPGSNPLFGLNTLGGALSLQTKDGRDKPGTVLELTGGSFGRKAAEFEHGGANRHGFNWYGATNLFFEDGWREASPSNVRQFFGRGGWQGQKTVLGLSFSYANNSLSGNGLGEQRDLARDYSSIYTKPDITHNRSPFLNLTVRHTLSSSLTFSGNVYYRYIHATSLNADLNENSLDQSLYQPSAADQAALRAAGYTGFPTSGATAANTPFPFWRCIAQVLQRDEPGEKCNGLLNRTNTQQHNGGASGQFTWFAAPRTPGVSRGLSRTLRNQFTAGAAHDQSSVGFLQSSQLGYINPDRSITGLNAFADGVTGGSVDGEPFDTRVDLDGRIHTSSLFATDTLSTSKWNFTLSGRYNHTNVDNSDRIQPQAGPGSLTSRNVFQRFNPAAGLTFNPTRIWNLYFGYSEGSRAPTSIELGCADPSQPCKLPNALAGDPPLKQVVTRTLEAGVRGSTESGLRWSAGWFRADNHDDILFVASTQTSFGYFKNFGRTLRQGIELDASTRIRRVTLGAGYTFLDATYQTPEVLLASGNSTNNGATRGVDGLIAIQPGAHIPLIPQHMFKANAGMQVTAKFSVDSDVVELSSSYARGNENNLHQPDGTYYLGSGTSPSYGVVSLGGRYLVQKHLECFVRVSNLFDQKYYSAAQLGPTGFTGQGSFVARPLPSVNGEFPIVHATFFAPGAPRGVWAGLRLKF